MDMAKAPSTEHYNMFYSCSFPTTNFHLLFQFCEHPPSLRRQSHRDALPLVAAQARRAGPERLGRGQRADLRLGRPAHRDAGHLQQRAPAAARARPGRRGARRQDRLRHGPGGQNHR